MVTGRTMAKKCGAFFRFVDAAKLAALLPHLCFYIEQRG